MKVEVAYALPDKQVLLEIDVPEGTTMFEAVQLSHIAEAFPAGEIAAETAMMGIFSARENKPKERVLQSGDRVEIYRPLILDPKEARRARAAKAKAAKAEKSAKQAMDKT